MFLIPGAHQDDNPSVMPEENGQLGESSLTDTRSEELLELQVPTEEDLATARELAESLGKVNSDARARAVVDKGLLKDLGPSFDPQTRQDPPGRHNCVSAKIVADFSELLECFDQVATLLGYNPPAPNQRRYAGPELRLRYCQIDLCDLSMSQIRWPIHLCGCRFRGSGTFMGATFAARANFEHSVFEHGADFGLSKFQGDASFSGAAFTAATTVSATFAGVTFCRHADFDLTHFAAAVQFDFGNFEEQTRFFRAQFRGPASFSETKFRDGAQFEFAAFGDRADFNGVFFQKAPDFHEAAFQNSVNFAGSNFEEYLDLRSATFGPEASLNVADLRVRASSVLGGNVRLRSSQLRSWRWWPMGWDSLIEADSPGKIKIAARSKTRASQARGEPGWQEEYKKALREQHPALESACSQYGVLEENFRAQGDPDSRIAEDFCHFRYHGLWRQTNRKVYSPLFWTNWFFLNLCFGYGVYPLRILIASILLFCLYGCLFATNGFGMFDKGWDVETTVTLRKVVLDSARPEVQETTRAVRMSELNGWDKWGSALYFSVTTYTTVGYGDWHPIGGAKFTAASEGLLGVFTMSVFTVSFARKIVR